MTFSFFLTSNQFVGGGAVVGEPGRSSLAQSMGGVASRHASRGALLSEPMPEPAGGYPSGEGRLDHRTECELGVDQSIWPAAAPTPGAMDAPTDRAVKLVRSASWRLVANLRKPRGSNLNV